MPHTAILGNRIFVALFESHIVVLGLGLFNHHVHDAEAGTFAGFFFFFSHSLKCFCFNLSRP